MAVTLRFALQIVPRTALAKIFYKFGSKHIARFKSALKNLHHDGFKFGTTRASPSKDGGQQEGLTHVVFN